MARTQDLDGLVSHYVLDGGKLVVAHAGLRQGSRIPASMENLLEKQMNLAFLFGATGRRNIAARPRWSMDIHQYQSLNG